MRQAVQARLTRALVPVIAVLLAAGCVGVGLHVGNATSVAARGGPLPSHILARLASADLAPPVASKPTTPITASPPPVEPAPPALRGALPVGKGMWLYMPSAVEGGNAEAIVNRANAVGLTHLFVRTGSSKKGFYAGDFLAQLLPVAHAHGIRVYGWDFPYLDNVGDDINRATQAIAFTAPGGDRIDGFSADIELLSMGVKVTPANALAYGAGLRNAVGPQYPLIATVPRPSPRLKNYPYAEVVQSFDAIAPMVYWLNREPVSDVVGALNDLAHFGKPVFPIGQAYDGAVDHGPPGVPGRAAIQAFMAAAEQHGANAVSFWSWQHASQEAWDAIRDATQFTLPIASETALAPAQVRAYQFMLTMLGFPTPMDGVLGQPLIDALKAYQQAAHLPVTGIIDAATKKILLRPFLSPLLNH